jgi:hypothetical protein
MPKLQCKTLLNALKDHLLDFEGLDSNAMCFIISSSLHDTFYASYAFYAWWIYFPQSRALAEGTSRLHHGHGHGHGVFIIT